MSRQVKTCRQPCNDMQAAMWWVTHCIIVTLPVTNQSPVDQLEVTMMFGLWSHDMTPQQCSGLIVRGRVILQRRAHSLHRLTSVVSKSSNVSFDLQFSILFKALYFKRVQKRAKKNTMKSNDNSLYMHSFTYLCMFKRNILATVPQGVGGSKI